MDSTFLASYFLVNIPYICPLRLGNLLIIMALIHAQRSGHRVIALIGGATAKIGDPSGKTSERAAMDDKEIER